MTTIKSFIKDESGFEGAEKALLICVGLAIILAVTNLVKAGADDAGKAAQNALKTKNMLN